MYVLSEYFLCNLIKLDQISTSSVPTAPNFKCSANCQANLHKSGFIMSDFIDAYLTFIKKMLEYCYVVGDKLSEKIKGTEKIALSELIKVIKLIVYCRQITVSHSHYCGYCSSVLENFKIDSVTRRCQNALVKCGRKLSLNKKKSVLSHLRYLCRNLYNKLISFHLQKSVLISNRSKVVRAGYRIMFYDP